MCCEDGAWGWDWKGVSAFLLLFGFSFLFFLTCGIAHLAWQVVDSMSFVFVLAVSGAGFSAGSDGIMGVSGSVVYHSCLLFSSPYLYLELGAFSWIVGYNT